MEWQPIETAPKDGTRIRVWDEDDDESYEVFWDGFMWGDETDVLTCARYWKPIPTLEPTPEPE